MRIQACLLSLLLAHNAQSADRCAEEVPEDAFIYRSQVSNWQQSPDAMELAFKKAYESENRLKFRFFVKSGQILAPLPQPKGSPAFAALPQKFVNMVKSHILDALSKKYAKYVFFPDMGHGHFRLWKSSKLNTPEFFGKGEAEVAQELMASDDLRILYHTAEQLSPPELRTLTGDINTSENKSYFWRLLNRHLVGSANPQQKLEVFLDDSDVSAAGYESVPGVVYLSANKNGCFSYLSEGQEIHFDMSLVPYGADPNAPPVEDGD